MLSVIVVSKNRHSILRRCLKSIVDNSTNIDLWVGYDEGDEETNEIGLEFGARTTSSRESGNRHKYLLNPIVNTCDGDYVISINDDVEVMTNNFDKVIDEVMYNSFKFNKVGYGICNERWSIGNAKSDWEAALGHQYACYPILTKPLINALGYFMPPQISGPGADITLSSIIFGADNPSFCNIPVSLFDHAHVSEKNQSRHYNRYTNTDLKKDIEKINAHTNS
jgi:hypothetical protein